MIVLDKGHKYQLDNIDEGSQFIQFVNKEPGREQPGVTTQEILRMLIDRTWYCDSCLPWEGNAEIVYHFRMALALHEARAIIRKVEKGELKPELVKIAGDGHFFVQEHDIVSGYAREPRNYTTSTGTRNPGEVHHG